MNMRFCDYKKNSRTTIICLLGCMILVCSKSSIAQVETNTATQLDPEVFLKDGFIPDEIMEGVWKRSEASGHDLLYAIKDGFWAMKRIDPQSGNVAMFWGGSYTLSGDVYMEKVEFGIPAIGRTYVYRVTTTAESLHKTGIDDNKVEEQWIRAEPVTDNGAKVSSTWNAGLMDSLVIIEVATKSGVVKGSGFAVDMDGKKYLVTNLHVIDCCESVRARTLKNELIIPISIEVSESVDLVRMEITNNVPALQVIESPPPIDGPIVVLGNSGGGGVATKINGNILGVGPDCIEVDAAFVQGNSGCPILNAEDKVIGVASFATLYEDPENWLSKDTRFQKIRRYGYRLDSVSWLDLPIQKFTAQTKLISDAQQGLYTYAITYMAFRNYTGKPSKPREPVKFYTKEVKEYYTNAYGQSTYRTVTQQVDNPKYETELAEWKRLYAIWEKDCQQWEEDKKFFQLADPGTRTFYSEKMKEKSTEHYRIASEMFLGQKGVRLKDAHKGQMMINLDSIKKIATIKRGLSGQKFESGFLQERAKELVEICDYVLDDHEKVNSLN